MKKEIFRKLNSTCMWGIANWIPNAREINQEEWLILVRTLRGLGIQPCSDGWRIGSPVTLSDGKIGQILTNGIAGNPVLFRQA